MPDAFAAVLRSAEKHLSKKVPEFGPVVAQIGRCTLTPDTDVFAVMVGAIVAQLISTAAARTIRSRVLTAAKGRVTPTNITRLSEAELRACGLSGAKARAILELASHFRGSRGFARKLFSADDDEARRMLLPLRGIGPWTVDMILMFSLGRTDVLPVGDFGLRSAVRDVYRLPDLPHATELRALAEPWRPYRSIATWYLWKSRGWVPQSEDE